MMFFGFQNFFHNNLLKKSTPPENPRPQISYLQDDDLLKSTASRRSKLENWQFRCACARCMIKIDPARGFRCLKCRAGAHYYIENVGKDAVTNCDICGEATTQSELQQCLSLEPQ